MSPNPSVSIVVPTFNVEPFLEQCLQSLVDQTLPDLQ
ncbi:MAG: glycosyltransferase, partial [Atopobiaceae bacterium]|nr:glycosyltransferase [Atopobiaceae bacterium]